MSNKEPAFYSKFVDLFIAVRRNKDQEINDNKPKCIRRVIKDHDLDLEILKEELVIRGGIWRIYKTVNSRNCKTAMKWLMKKMIDHPEISASIDSWWRTALMQKEHAHSDKMFMLDVDTTDTDIIIDIMNLIPSDNQVAKIDTLNGCHIITEPFDTRELLSKYSCVTLLRDGQYFIDTIGIE